MDRIIQILQKKYDRVEYAMKLGRSIGKENAPEFKQLEKELEETGTAIKILTTNADTGEKQCNLPVVSHSSLQNLKTYWVNYDNEWQPTKAHYPYERPELYFKFLNGMIVQCSQIAEANIKELCYCG